MRYIKLFEEIRDLTPSEYSNIDSREDLTIRDRDVIIDYSNRNVWDSFEKNRNSDYRIEFYKKDGDLSYNIDIERQEDEYYLVSIEFNDLIHPKNDDERFLLLDGYEELVEFLQRVEKFYIKRVYNIKYI